MSRQAGLNFALVLVGLFLPVAGLSATPEPYVLELEIKARFQNSEFARVPFLDSLALLRFAEDQPWAREIPEPTQLQMGVETVEGSAIVSAPGAPEAGSTVAFFVGGERVDVSLDGVRFERVELATGTQFRAQLPVVLQLDDPAWVGFSAELIEIEGLRPRLQVRVENRSSEVYRLPALRIRGERRRARRPTGSRCTTPPEADLPRVKWHWQLAATAGSKLASQASSEAGMAVVQVRVGGCEVQWMALDLPVERDVPPGGELRIMAVPLIRPETALPPGRDARIDGVSGWDAVRVSVTPPGPELPPEIVLNPRTR